MKPLYMIISFCLIFAVCLIPSFRERQSVASVGVPITERVLIIDAGHGGFDGGAVAYDGTLEKDLNLLVALKVKKIADCLGFKTVATRTSDISTDDSSQEGGSKKVRDIKNRVKMMQKYPNGIFVSIHMNKYGTSQPFGAQAFYSPFKNSNALAENIQSTIAQMVQKNNKRVIKPAGNDIYLLHNAVIPAVIIECGFLSNDNDLRNLKDENYRNELAFSIVCGIINYYNEY